MTEAALRTPLCIYMTTKTLLRPMLHRLSPNEGRMHFFALLPHQLTKYSNAMAMVSMAGHVFVAIWHAARQATGLANTALEISYEDPYVDSVAATVTNFPRFYRAFFDQKEKRSVSLVSMLR